ncbi:MAG: hypothetical protein V3574_00995 [Candidatus Moraniibacteriota bacterium]
MLSLFLKPIIIWLVIQFLAAGFYLGKDRFIENKFRIINSATILVIILNSLLIASEHILQFNFGRLIFQFLELILSVTVFYLASKKYLPSENPISNQNLTEGLPVENNDPQIKRRKIIFAMIILVVVYSAYSFFQINRVISELPNMQKVFEQFISDIQNNDLESASNLLVNELQGAESREFSLNLSKNFESIGGIKEYRITSSEARISGFRIYGNFTGQILFGNGKAVPFILTIMKENGQYKIHILNFSSFE